MPTPHEPAGSTGSILPPVARTLLDAARTLSDSLATLRFAPPVAHVYDPLTYAWAPYERYVRRFGAAGKRIVLLGMNPGPFGMMQTGVPFGEVAAVRDWMGIEAPVQAPATQHPARPITGFACTRSEVSGRRLWGWAALRWGTAERFFEDCFVLNYCPLVWLEASGRNRTPVQLPADELRPVHAACDLHLAAALQALSPQWAIGVGGFAEARLRTVLQSGLVDGAFAREVRIGQILHPSPASPAANRGWTEAVDARFAELGLAR
jgi:single-strand selective monofunctional uracil DNA glycosylase